MNKKKLSTMLVSLIMGSSLVLSACSNNSAPANNSGAASPQPSASVEPSKAPSSDPVTLRYVRGSAVSENEQKMLDLFTEQNPSIKIQIEQAKGGGVNDMLEKAAALQAAGTPADLIWVQDILPFVKDELLVDLTPYMTSDPVLSTAKIPDSSLKALQFNGKQVALPRAENPIIIFVNKDLLAKNGIDMPKNDWTWDDYRNIAKQVTKPDEGEYGIAYGHFNSIITAGVLGVANGSSENLYFMDADWKQSKLTTPEARRDIEWIADLQRVDHSIGAWEVLEKSGTGWMSGNVAFEIHGVWEGKNRREKAKFNWDVLPLPKGKVKQIGYNVGTGIGILKASANPDAAAKFLSFMHTMEAQKLGMANGDFPLTEDEELKQALVETPIWKGTNILATIGVEMRAEPVGAIVGADQYVQWWSDDVQHAFKEGKDLNKPIFDQAAHFNEATLKLRQELGLQ
ncbi:sugar ABC transporter substrate-binding protein [Paenibacillus pasadenensis]|uniref:ABC transporter substrate-binding protein n=1 Tax=Paenibacillus pasadenensis TaxID=217090 RepID=UPI00203B9828|nr:sugar ABC transporter substrate-binding protein [Paenibacillus pasadenensis]MCM3749049.1 sugar ABC transporter substrate-binding protein [Paenibacillus pasadenensis]